MLTSVDLSQGGGGEETYQRIITETLTNEMRSAGFRIVAPAEWESRRASLGIAPEDLVLAPSALRLGQAVSADVVAAGFHHVDGTRIIIQVKFYDVGQGRLIASVIDSARVGLSVYNAVNAAVLRVVSQLEGPLPPLQPEVVPVDDRIKDIVIRSETEGAEILVGGRLIGEIADGRMVIPSVSAGLLEVEKRRQGYHSARETLDLSSGDAEIWTRPLLPETRWALEVASTTGQTLGLGTGLRYYPNPDRLFVGADNYFYLQHSLAPGALPVYHSDVRLLAGHYFLRGPEKRLRLGAGAGLGGIFSWFSAPGIPMQFDLYLNVASGWVEWNRGPWALFLRVEGKYALGLESGLLARGWLEIGDWGPPTTVGVTRKW